MNGYLGMFKKYSVFNGRAGRQEFWMAFVINIVVSVAVTMFDAFMGLGFLHWIYQAAVLIPGLALVARRLHDTNRSGWWMLIGLIPVIGIIALLVFMAQEGDARENQHGPNPKAA